MRTLTIDRFEGSYAICEDNEERWFAIEQAELPKGASEGDILEINNDGIISVNAEKTAERREKLAARQRKLFGE